MCSQVLQRRIPSPSEHVDALKKALVDVAQESFFSFAEYCQPDRFAEAIDMMPPSDSVSGGRWLTARVAFTGAFSGRVTVVVPYGLASDMAASIAGIMPGETIEDALVLDSTGEFTNMVCGTWLTRACARRRFDLSPPAVSSSAALPAANDEDEDLLLINDWPVKLAVAFESQ